VTTDERRDHFDKKIGRRGQKRIPCRENPKTGAGPAALQLRRMTAPVAPVDTTLIRDRGRSTC
jgi:hypothetical protein